MFAVKPLVAHPPWFDKARATSWDRLLALLVVVISNTLQALCAQGWGLRALATLFNLTGIVIALEALCTHPPRFDEAITTQFDRLFALLVILGTDALQALGTPVRVFGTFVTLLDTALLVLTNQAVGTHPPWFN